MRLILCLSVLLPIGIMTGCHPRNHTEHGAMVGSTAGALLGGIIGHQSGNTGDGAVLGALAGGLTGSRRRKLQRQRRHGVRRTRTGPNGRSDRRH